MLLRWLNKFGEGDGLDELHWKQTEQRGIILLWDERAWKGEVLEIGTYSITCKFESQLQNFNCHITNVYVPNCYKERRLVWEELGSVKGLLEGSWAICGVFNVSRFHSEKRIT
uniref:Putative ovule protein n=1 Tax=Solanum chacoense TaxID=4108 RepID=A0A0V0ITW5_SOLCH